jgi:hypothetical protein
VCPFRPGRGRTARPIRTGRGRDARPIRTGAGERCASGSYRGRGEMRVRFVLGEGEMRVRFAPGEFVRGKCGWGRRDLRPLCTGEWRMCVRFVPGDGGGGRGGAVGGGARSTARRRGRGARGLRGAAPRGPRRRAPADARGVKSLSADAWCKVTICSGCAVQSHSLLRRARRRRGGRGAEREAAAGCGRWKGRRASGAGRSYAHLAR